jgi:hypothetical protein
MFFARPLVAPAISNNSNRRGPPSSLSAHCARSAKFARITLFFRVFPCLPAAARATRHFGTTMEIGCFAVPPRRFCPITTMVCSPGSSGSVK